ncbi:hypothetical protein BC833DRAFT_315649 [Globomyces pollinis-pini]|nr:hypothetical protein BC833DRAFT_315649 [Globomyces pollinis-pini]
MSRLTTAKSNAETEQFIVNPLWGFDPLDLLAKTEFPNDHNEYKIRHSQEARRNAIRRIPLETLDEVRTLKTVYISEPGKQGAEQNIEKEQEKLLKSKIQQDQLARSAACLMIQACFRGWSTRRRYIVIINAIISTKTHRDGALLDPLLPNVRDLRIQEKLRRRYLHWCMLFDRASIIPPEYSQYCAAIIQANWKRFLIRRAYKKYMTKMKVGPTKPKSREGMEKQEALDFLKYVANKPAQHEQNRNCAALIIQRAWKRYYNTRIYYFYRDLIKIRENGHPKQMLKFINPKEADLIDRGMAVHVRFRLGGVQFPPMIFYKIFAHKSLIDMNSFAPKDYTAQESKQMLPRTLFLNDKPLPVKDAKDEWYQRFEGNDWRPVIETFTGPFASNSIHQTELQKNLFHYSKLTRHQDVMKKRKNKQLQWMRKLYSLGNKLQSTMEESSKSEKPRVGWLDLQKGMQVEADPMLIPVKSKPIPKRETKDQELDRIIKEIEVQEMEMKLIGWTKGLNFQDYHDNWLNLAATAPSDKDPRHHIGMLETEHIHHYLESPDEYQLQIDTESCQALKSETAELELLDNQAL